MGTFIVFGAGRPGIGQAVATRLAADGNRVLGTYDPEYASEIGDFPRDSSSIILTEVDHADPTAVRSFLQATSEPLAGLVIAEFYFSMEDPEKFDLDKWNRSLAVNLTLPKLAFHVCQPRFVPTSAMSIVTSTEGFIGSFGAHAYASTKAAVHNLVKSLANISDGLPRVNAVAAGWIGGVMDTDDVFNMSREITPLGRLGGAEEIAGVVAFLSSPDAGFVNGTVITADGGYSGVDTISKYEFRAEFGDTK